MDWIYTTFLVGILKAEVSSWESELSRPRAVVAKNMGGRPPVLYPKVGGLSISWKPMRSVTLSPDN
jgi:hypothetical protein